MFEIMEGIMTKSELLGKSVVAGCQEIYSNGTTDLTDGEQAAIGYGAGVAWAGVVCMGAAAVVPALAAGMLCAKVMVVGGCASIVGGLGKAFVRGFREGMDFNKKHR